MSEENIIYRLKKAGGIGLRLWQFWFCMSRILGIIFLVYLITFYLSKSNFLVVILFCAFSFFQFLRDFYMFFNFKILYLTEKELVIKKYIGKDLVFSLGNVYTYEASVHVYLSVFFVSDKIVFETFTDRWKNTTLFSVMFEYKDFEELDKMLKLHFVKYLASLEQEEYLRIKNLNNGNSRTFSYFNEIDKLRKEQENGK